MSSNIDRSKSSIGIFNKRFCSSSLKMQAKSLFARKLLERCCKILPGKLPQKVPQSNILNEHSLSRFPLPGISKWVCSHPDRGTVYLVHTLTSVWNSARPLARYRVKMVRTGRLCTPSVLQDWQIFVNMSISPKLHLSVTSWYHILLLEIRLEKI